MVLKSNEWPFRDWERVVEAVDISWLTFTVVLGNIDLNYDAASMRRVFYTVPGERAR
jgi:hypothetical protein